MTGHRALRPLLIAAGFAVTGVCVYFTLRGVELSETEDALRDSDLRWLVPAGAVLMAGLLLRALRWWTLFATAHRPPLPSVTRALFIGYFFNYILPARAGEAAKVIALHRDTGTPKAETVGTVVIERVFDVIALLVLLFAAYPLLPSVAWLDTAALFAGVVLVALSALVYVLVRYEERAVRTLLSPLRRIRGGAIADRVEPAVANGTRGLVALRDPWVAARAMGLTLVSWMTLAAAYWIAMEAFALGLDAEAGVLVIVAINLSLILPSSPAGLGVFEAATVVALNAFDVPQSEALSYALVLHALDIAPALLIGAVILGPAALRHRRRAAPDPPA